MKRQTLSVAMIVRNEAHNLPRALESIRSIADEVIVVDTGSTDDTVEIAKGFGARVFTTVWQNDFAGARNYSLEQATGDWVLVLDADEAVTEQFCRGLPEHLGDPKVDAWDVVMVSYRGEGTVTQRTPAIRLIRNKPYYRFRYRVHEVIHESILERGGVVKSSPLEIEHFGYTRAEDKRKDRRRRNINLLKQGLDENPRRDDLWFYLGSEYYQLGELDEARFCFETKLKKRSFDDMSGLSAASLAEILLSQNLTYEGWQVARLGIKTRLGVADSRFRVHAAAVAEGDYVEAEAMVRELQELPQDALGLLSRTQPTLLDMQALVLWERGQRQQALALWQKAAELAPTQLQLADNWVQHLFMVKGLRDATVGLVQQTGLVTVAAAVVGVLLRAGETNLASSLTNRFAQYHVPSAYFVHGLARQGMWSDAQQAAARAELLGAMQLATIALIMGNEQVLAEAREDLPAYLNDPLEAVISGQQPAAERVPGIRMWFEQWALTGCYDLMRAAAVVLPGGRDVWEAAAARVIYRTNPAVAVAWAEQHADQPDALEVLGLNAFEKGNLEQAADWLQRRAWAGPAAVRVYHLGTNALRRIGREAEAETLLKLGRQHRPISPLLRKGLQ